MTMLAVPYALGQLGVSGTPDPFAAVGFSVASNGLMPTLNGALAFSGVGDRRSFLGIGAVGDPFPAGVTLDGVPVVNSQSVPPTEHPNGSYEIDHIVILTPNVDTTAHQAAAVLGLRQLRTGEVDGHRQSFHRFADVTHPDGRVTKGCILEIVEDSRVSSARLWGVVFNTYELAAIVAKYGPDVLSEPRTAIQSGRQIATFQPAAGLGIQVAMMSPHPHEQPA